MDFMGWGFIVAAVCWIVAFVQDQIGIREISREMCRREQIDFEKLTRTQKTALHVIVASKGQVGSPANYWGKY